MRVARQCDDLVAQPVELEALAECEIDLCGRRNIEPGSTRELDDVQRWNQSLQVHYLLRERRWHACHRKLCRRVAGELALGSTEQRRQDFQHGLHARREVPDRRGDVESAPPVAEQPTRGALEQNPRPEQHRKLRLLGYLPVERLDLA